MGDPDDKDDVSTSRNLSAWVEKQFHKAAIGVKVGETGDPGPPVLRFTYEWLRLPLFLCVPYGTPVGSKAAAGVLGTPRVPEEAKDPDRPLLALFCPRSCRILATSEFGEGLGDLRSLVLENHWEHLRKNHAERMVSYQLEKIRWATEPETSGNANANGDVLPSAFQLGSLQNWGKKKEFDSWTYQSINAWPVSNTAQHYANKTRQEVTNVVWNRKGFDEAISDIAARLAIRFPGFRHAFREQIDQPGAAYAWAKAVREERHLVRELACSDPHTRNLWVWSWPQDVSKIPKVEKAVLDSLGNLGGGFLGGIPKGAFYLDVETDFGQVEKRMLAALGVQPPNLRGHTATASSKKIKVKP